MRKILVKLIVVTSLGLISLLGIWFPFAIQPRPAQAKEAIEAAQFPHSAEPGARPLSAGFNITVSQIISSGFVNPVQVTHAGDGSNRLFVVEQYGRIRIINSSVATPFLDIRSIVRSQEPGDNGGSEEGLLSVAFHPNYEVNGYFYVFYNNTSGNLAIVRYSVSANPNLANLLSATPILTIPHPTNANHNGGQLFFGPLDGYLYISTGDGGGGNDPDDNAQNINSLLGKILRIDVNSGSPYDSPPGNPYDGATAGRDEIWALGLRNPWRYSFDRGSSTGTGKGDLYIGDVGQGAWEEISYQAAGTLGGLNYGWDVREGPCPTGLAQPCAAAPAQFTDPIAFYVNAGDNIAVTGGFVYRGSQYAALVGYYFYADFGSGRIWSIQKTGSTFSTPEEELNTDLNISGFGEDEQGEVYVVDHNGAIHRLADVNGPSPNLSASQKIASGPGIDPGETLTYTILIKNTNGLTSAEPVFLTDQIPPGLAYVPGSLAATQGSVDPSQNPTLRWQGALSPTASVTVTYQVTATGVVTGLLINQAVITSASVGPITRTYPIFVPRPFPTHLPVIFK